MGILIVLVIATIIITGVFVGYHAWQSSLHEGVEKHAQPDEIETFQTGKINLLEFDMQAHQNYLIK